MQEAGGQLLVSRILVQTDLPYRAMRVDLSHAGALRDPQGPAGCERCVAGFARRNESPVNGAGHKEKERKGRGLWGLWTSATSTGLDARCAGCPVNGAEPVPAGISTTAHGNCRASGGEHSPAQVLRVERLAELAESLAAGGLLLRGDGSMLGRSGLRRALRHLRACFAGWIALQTRGPDPADLQAVLTDGLLNFVDLQLSWEEIDADTARPGLRMGPSLAALKSVLRRSTCPCVLRFTSPAEGEIFSKVSGVFDAFVRNSHEPVAVRVFEAAPVLQDRAAGGDGGELLEFVACRPAWLLEDSAGEWLNLPADANTHGLDNGSGPGPLRRVRF